MTYQELSSQIFQKDSYLCVGLDTDIGRLPEHLRKIPDPVFEFNRRIIDSTYDLCVAYKLNIAFYESLGPEGWISLRKTVNHIPDTHFIIADAKRGDIGNTSRMYARTFFQTYPFDAITVNPYMGRDSVEPFLEFPGKWVILLCLTSNQGSRDFQVLSTGEGMPVYEQVIETSREWGDHRQLMYVVGATHPEQLGRIRNMLPDSFFLIPGVGAQGGDLEAISQAGWNDNCGMLVNSSRGIIYADSSSSFAESARAEATKLQEKMKAFMAGKTGS